MDDSNGIVELDNTNNTLDMTLSVAPPGLNPDVIDRGSTSAITAGTTLAGNTFTPTAGALLVVIAEGTTV